MWQSVGLTLLVIVATLACVLLFMLCGWYVVWQLFLSKFKFLRELIGDTGSQQGIMSLQSLKLNRRLHSLHREVDRNQHDKEGHQQKKQLKKSPLGIH